MSDPIKLVPRATVSEENKQDVINTLNQAVELAQTDDVKSVLIIFCRQDGSWGHMRSDLITFPESIGRLTIAMHEWINIYLRETEK